MTPDELLKFLESLPEANGSVFAASKLPAKQIKLGIVGARARDTEEDLGKLIKALEYILNKYSDVEFMFVSGGCKRGADAFCKAIAEDLNIRLIEHLPFVNDNCTREEYAKACYERNRLIAIDADILIALPAGSGGTENTIKYMKNLGKPVVLL